MQRGGSFFPGQDSDPSREVFVSEIPNRASSGGPSNSTVPEDPEFLESRGRVNPCAVWGLEAGGLKQKCVGASGEGTLRGKKKNPTEK